LLRGDDFLKTPPVTLVELKGFVESILEVVGAPFLRELVLEAAADRWDKRAG